MKQHKWHKEIKAWADGAEIEMFLPISETWVFVVKPHWDDDIEYRIKPQPKEPQYLYVYEDSFCGTDDVDIRAGTRIMRKKVKEWECNYLGKIKLENDNGSA